MRVFVVIGRTESGDDVGPYVWDFKPSNKLIHATISQDWLDEYEAFGKDGGLLLNKSWAEVITNG